VSLQRKIKLRKVRRKFRTKNKINQPVRVSVFRSLNNIYAQLIDDAQEKTLVSFSSLQVKNQKGDKKEVARLVGVELAKQAIGKGINQAVFDRGGFKYHGRVQALAEGLREGGLQV
jgi:large subunit ribosomal protein L18